MTNPITIPANERGVVRVFALSMTDIEASALKDNPKAVAGVLGTQALPNLEHIELFPVSDLDGVGLLAYLHDGAGVPQEQLTPDRVKLDRLGGWVMVVFSLAFEDVQFINWQNIGSHILLPALPFFAFQGFQG